jgi:hypothetical protein
MRITLNDSDSADRGGGLGVPGLAVTTSVRDIVLSSEPAGELPHVAFAFGSSLVCIVGGVLVDGAQTRVGPKLPKEVKGARSLSAKHLGGISTGSVQLAGVVGLNESGENPISQLEGKIMLSVHINIPRRSW